MHSVKKRETFYLSGYDPRGARHYYNLYKKESKKQSQINGIDMKISSKKSTDEHIQSWQIDAKSKAFFTKTTYHFLAFDDLIREKWKYSIITLLSSLWFYSKTYLFTGVIFKLIKASPPQAIPLLYPIFYLLCLALLAIFVPLMFYYFTSIYIPYFVAFSFAGLFSFYILKIGLKLGDKLNVLWLLRIYVFSGKYVLEKNKALEERIETFAHTLMKTVKNAKENNVDEVLIVSHSVGTILFVSILSKMLASPDIKKEDLKVISVLTLGQCIPLVSFLETSTVFKKQMQDLVKEKHFTWLDYSSKIDGACFPFVDYYDYAGIETKHTPVALSPRFHLLYTKEAYKSVKKDRFIVHFLYLMSTELEGAYDYFKMTAGHTRVQYSDPKELS